MPFFSLDDSQWEQYGKWITQLQWLAAKERDAALLALAAKGEIDPVVLSWVEWHFRRRPEPDRCRSGERIGAFTLGHQIGAGGMGVVYQAQQHIAGHTREVAVKLIHPTWLMTERDDAMARFCAEIRMLLALEHEGIARIYDGRIYTDESTQEELPYIAMQLVPHGKSLTSYAKECSLSVQKRLELFLRVCDAVRYAHERRVVHRDLKPANILVNGDERPIVIDFGLARAYDAMVPGASMVSGTRAYMSPEQISSAFGSVSEKSDVYALGLILYELLAGHRPYELPADGSLEQLRQAIVEAIPLPLSHYDRAYRGELEAIITAALAKQPAERITVDVLRARLKHYIEAIPGSSETGHTSPPEHQREHRQQSSDPENAPKEVSRHSWVTWIFGVLLLAFIVGAAFVSLYERQRSVGASTIDCSVKAEYSIAACDDVNGNNVIEVNK